VARVITVTMNPAVDVAVEVDRVRPNAKLRTGSPQRDPGGGGINVARVLTRLGVEAEAWFPAGGPAGERLKGLLEQEGVPHRGIPIQGDTRENVTVTEEGSGDQYRFVLPGPRLDEGEWSNILESLSGMGPPPLWVVGSGSLPPGVPDDFWGWVAEVAAERGIRVALDTSGDALAAALEVGVELLKPNARELGELAGRTLETEEDQEEAARAVVEGGGARLLVLSLGASGALGVGSDGFLERVPAPSVRPRSRVGAGDSMMAGLVAALAAGEDWSRALRTGVAAGAAAVATDGTGLARAGDVERLLA
jgi:6-phosphofructokinase 2